jgi:hypothetical protein
MIENNHKQEIDPDVLEKIRLLENAPERNPELAQKGKTKFLAELDAVPFAGTASSQGWLARLLNTNEKSGASLTTGGRKFALSSIAAILLVVAILFGGASATAFASQSALPGDALYPVKTGLEQTQISLANDAYNRAQLYLSFAQRRLDEITELLSQGRTNDIEFASGEFENFIREAMLQAQIVQGADPERGAELNKLVSQALLDYASALKSVLVTAPDAVKPLVEKALLASQDGAGDEVEIFGVVTLISDEQVVIDGEAFSIASFTEFEDAIQVGDRVKVHAIITSDGLMVVREIELSSLMEDTPGISGDDNQNESELNENENENEDRSGSNLNENSSDDNSNEHDQEDDSNANESTDDQDGSNSNESETNENSDDEKDDSNDKSGKSGSSNDNDNDDHTNDNSGNDNDNDSEHEDNSNDSNDNDHEDDGD